MSEEKTTSEKKITCPECLAGIMRMDRIVYFTWLAGELITVPDFPAWVCDMCGRREFDPQAVSRLNILLNPSTGRRAQSEKSKRPPRTSPPAQP
jgi:YgiT-type zinc finger domain-containing protein